MSGPAASHALLLDAFARELALRDPDGSRSAGVSDSSSVVEQAVERMLSTSAAWSEQLGPVYDTAGVMAILGVTRQAVSKRRLLALTTSSGRAVYPAFQFTGSGVVPGLAAALSILESPEVGVSPWTVASWLVSPAGELDEATPIQMLTAGEFEAVSALARQWARALAA
jgi:hypothetical protein